MQKEQGLFLNYALIPNSLYSFYVDDVKVKLKPLNVIADKIERRADLFLKLDYFDNRIYKI
jgi:hypothetical protein